MNNSIGNIFRITTFGESHGKSIGCIIDGCPVGIKLNKQIIQKELDKRKPGTTKYVTPRKEKDKIKILSGIYKKRTCGTPIGIIVKNTNTISKDYSNIKNLFRPGHADITYKLKYKIRDHKGGGRSSARTTISLVIAGAIAKEILKKFFNIKIFCYIKRIGKLKIKTNKYTNKIESFFCQKKKTKKKIIKLLNKIIKNSNSIGCKLNINIKGIMPGIGDPLYEKLDSNLTKSIMNLNAVKSIEIGKGKKSSKIKGSKNNDIFYKEGFLSNNAGGFLGGISTGQEINIKVYIKPTSSILKKQITINNKIKEKKIKIKGRHDPCVGLRAAPILESICSINIIESILKQKIINFY